LLHVFCIAVLLSFGVLAQFKLKPKVLVAQYDAVAIERIKAEWMQSPLWMKDYHILLNGIQSLQNDINMLRRNLLNEGEIGADASFKPRRLAAAEESIFDSLSDEEREQWIDIMPRINWASLKGGDRRRLPAGEVLRLNWNELHQKAQPFGTRKIQIELDEKDSFGRQTVFDAYVTNVDKDKETGARPTLDVKTGASEMKNKCTWIGDRWQLSTTAVTAFRDRHPSYNCKIFWINDEGQKQEIQMIP